MKSLFVLLLIIFIVSCKNGSNNVVGGDSLKKDSLLNHNTNNDNNEKKIAKDFVVDDIKFRYKIINTDSGYINIVEKFDGTKWIECLTYQFSNKEDNILNDINDDGFIDIFNEWRWASDVYLYNPKTKSFIKEPISILNDFHELDAKEKIFCELSIFKSTQNGTNLFKIDDSKRIDLFSIDFIDDTTKSSEDSRGIYDNLVIGYNLYKGSYLESDKRTLLKTVHLNKVDEFDYEKFWKENYKQLLAANP